MNHELIIQLRDAGFPYAWHKAGNPEPPLDLLIKECGSQIDKIQFNPIRAFGRKPKGQRQHFYDQGGTSPEEAVAKLWLALNKK